MTDKKVEEKAPETKGEKFKRLATSRTSKAMDAIANLRGLVSITNYEYTADDWAKIFAALEGELGKLQTAVKNPTATVAEGFSL